MPDIRNGTATSPPGHPRCPRKDEDCAMYTCGFCALERERDRAAALEITRDDGLTDAEGKVMDAALAVVNGYSKLPVEHPNDMRDICDAVHRIQDLLAVRIARRAFPKGWPTKGGATQ